ncbi:hypothetical protein EYR41_011819 [Orbilia oligospora]|uniref:Uncharacterized protein n=1 Tax=Orbilia oligospora TaxID=2813651 RepID=A0A7C8KLF9_ORBOL|nr:hypothetical protein TWF751_003111 [Orbilia oligospora]TGJ62629.1 hypothetical protein EYR41_011819 [Orbilia oligospora]
MSTNELAAKAFVESVASPVTDRVNADRTRTAHNKGSGLGSGFPSPLALGSPRFPSSQSLRTLPPSDIHSTDDGDTVRDFVGTAAMEDAPNLEQPHEQHHPAPNQPQILYHDRGPL